MTRWRRLRTITDRLDRLGTRLPSEDLGAVDPEIQALIDEAERRREMLERGEDIPPVEPITAEEWEWINAGSDGRPR